MTPTPISRRAFAAAVAAAATALSTAKSLSALTPVKPRLGLCTFSCHQHWKAVSAKTPGTRFTDALGFARYVIELGAEGVQTQLRSRELFVAQQFRRWVEETGAYFEADLNLPKTADDLDSFESDVQLAREAGAEVARAVFTSGRRYEVFHQRHEFDSFAKQAEDALQLAEPVLARHRLKLAMENHKDHTAEELARLINRISSPWIGVLVDTGNNLALLEDPDETLEHLAPLAMSVHLKDMAVQPSSDGFLLSEVPLGTGALDLPHILDRLLEANPKIVFNLEMATRDPLSVPCRLDRYYATMPDRRRSHFDRMMKWVESHPLKSAPPSIQGKPIEQVLHEEELNNQTCIRWMKEST